MLLPQEENLAQQCRASGENFLVKPEDISFYEKKDVPLPTLSPVERLRRRMAFRNYRNLYRRPCSETGQMLISMYDSTASFPVVSSEYWWSDRWDARDFALALNLKAPFFRQFAALSAKVPRYPISNVNCENSEYANFSVDSRDCYLVFGCVRSHGCLYGHIVWDCRDCIDNLYIYKCELVSHSIDLVDCYNVHFSHESANCVDCYYIYNCRNCSNCIGCFGLRSQQFCIFNQQYSEAEYREREKALVPPCADTIVEVDSWLCEQQRRNAIVPAIYGLRNENVSGNHLYYCSNVFDSFDVKQSCDVRHSFTTLGTENSYDIAFSSGSTQFCYECINVGGCENVLFSEMARNCANCAYCQFCIGCNDLFGCIGLRNAEYCILNKQYSKEEYCRLRDLLIAQMRSDGEWGEYFPVTLSPFSYNESIASEYFPLSKSDALERGYRWSDSIVGAIDASQISYRDAFERENTLSDKNVSICPISGESFRITKEELKLYAKLNLPKPRYSPAIRHLMRMHRRDPRTLSIRRCGLCSAETLSAISEASASKVLCETCYLKSLS